VLNLDGNQLTGDVPPKLGNLTALKAGVTIVHIKAQLVQLQDTFMS